MSAILAAMVGAQPFAPATGQWTAPYVFPATQGFPGTAGLAAIHMVLMPSSGDYKAKVVWWSGEVAGARTNGQFGWNPADAACSQGVTAALTDLGPLSLAGFNIFCAGQTPITGGSGGIGRVLVTGGTETGTAEIGIRRAGIYDPGTNSWQSVTDMGRRRWYPTNTTLAGTFNGKTLVSSGSYYPYSIQFGGREIGASAPDDFLRRLGLTTAGVWDSRHSTSANPVFPIWPQAREGHTLIEVPNSNGSSGFLMFGGQTGATTFANDLRFLATDELPTTPDYGYSWVPVTASGSPPSGRADHVMVPDGNGGVILIGGRGFVAGGQVTFPDVWHFQRTGEYSGIWRERNVTGIGPGARYDHVAVLNSDHHRVLVFGGRSAVNGALADNAVYALDIQNIGNPSADLEWKIPTVIGTPPTARAGAVLVHDRYARQHHAMYFGYSLVFGGETNPGGLSNEVWELRTSLGSESVQWRQVPIAGGPPAARSQSAAVFDGRMVIIGGDCGAVTDDAVWAFKVPIGPDNYLPDDWSSTWESLALTPPMPVATKNSAAVNQGLSGVTRISEIFDQNGPGGGSWAALSGNQLESLYPFHFLLPDGYVFSAGARQESYRLNLTTGTWQPWPATANTVPFWSGSAVQFRPGEVMKCGSYYPSVPNTGATMRIDLNSAIPQWTNSGSMLGRIYHNLVLLPTGEVLVTGGLATPSDSDPRRRPQIWNPAANVWYSTTALGESLATDPVVRDYHSTALLLPDARILTAGGNTSYDKDRFAIYCPPYLFSANGLPAQRPVIQSAPEVVAPGWNFDVCVSGLAGSDANFCLISSASTTHGFDQNQRYVPLTKQSVCAGKFQLQVPSNPNIVPDGNYMLFCVGPNGVPSVSTWVLINSGAQGSPPFCSCGGGCPYVDVKTAAGWATENTILGRSSSGEFGDDAYRIKLSPDTKQNLVTVRLRENEQEVTTLDQAKLLVVDRPAGLKVLGSNSGVVAGMWTPAWRVTTSKGEDITTLVDGSSLGGWWGSAGDTVLVDLDPPKSGFSAQASQDGGGGTMGGDPKEQELRYDPAGSGGSARARPNAAPTLATDADWLRKTGVRVQRPDGSGGWSDVAHWYPRQFADESYFPEMGSGRTRLIFVGDHRLTSIGRLQPAASGVTTQVLTPSMASHSRLGSVSAEVAAGGSTTVMAAGDTVTLSFVPPATVPGMERDYVLVTRGVYTSNVKPARLMPQPKAPTQFALLQNRPNPFEETTAIQFELPRSSHVRIEIFDLVGRHVRTLADGNWPAGYHSVDWDRRNESGEFLRSGVYVYRIAAGEFRDQRKMILMPR